MNDHNEGQVAPGQRRLRHLSRVLVRGITNATSEQLPGITSRPSALRRGSSIDDLDLELRRKKASSNRRISLNQATRSPQSTPTKELELRLIARPRTFSSASIKTVASREEDGDDEQLLSPIPMPRIRRDRATSLASMLSQASSTTVFPAESFSTSRSQSEPQPQCCLTLSLPSVIEGKGKAPACFFASEAVTSHNPTFEIDPEAFQHADDYLLRQSRFVVEVWVSEAESSEWKLHLQWDVDMDGLTALGDDLSASSSQLQDNMLIFCLSNGEYLTAPSVNASILSSYERLPEQSSPVPEQDDDAGALSDPGTSEALVTARATKAATDAQKRDRESRRKGIEISKKERRMLPSIGVGGIVRLLTLQTCIDDMRALTQQSVAKLDRLVDDSGGLQHLKRKQDAARARIQTKEAEIAKTERAITEAQSTARHRKEELAARRQKLAEAEEMRRIRCDALEETADQLFREQATYAKLQNSVLATRASRVSELDSIFYIRPSDSALQFSICEVPLANSNFNGADDDSVSSALGLTAQLVDLLSRCLGIVLPYPLACRGSRSLVSDPITGGIRGVRAFPLYSKGVDRYRFEYAVFLLNKDVEHLLTLHRPRQVAVLDLKQTLPNLYNLILTATAASFEPSNGSASPSQLMPPAPIVSSSSDSASDAGDSDVEERAPSIRSFASGNTVRPGSNRKNSDEKRASSTTRAAEKLRALTSGATASVVHG